MKLSEAAKVMRSKNAGPLKLTLDLMFEDAATYEKAAQAPALSASAIAPLYGLDAAQVEVIAYRPALAIKVVMDRTAVSGSPGDRDVYGAQQHAPLLETEI
jgi:hypothetical protein